MNSLMTRGIRKQRTTAGAAKIGGNRLSALWLMTGSRGFALISHRALRRHRPSLTALCPTGGSWGPRCCPVRASCRPGKGTDRHPTLSHHCCDCRSHTTRCRRWCGERVANYQRLVLSVMTGLPSSAGSLAMFAAMRLASSSARLLAISASRLSA